jgi:hypothetical protein
MIALSVFPVVCALQGGVRMSSPPSFREVRVTPVQVWPALSSDLRTRVVGLLAQLALNVVAARPGTVCTGKEVACAHSATVSKNPS